MLVYQRVIDTEPEVFDQLLLGSWEKNSGWIRKKSCEKLEGNYSSW